MNRIFFFIFLIFMMPANAVASYTDNFSTDVSGALNSNWQGSEVSNFLSISNGYLVASGAAVAYYSSSSSDTSELELPSNVPALYGGQSPSVIVRSNPAATSYYELFLLSQNGGNWTALGINKNGNSLCQQTGLSIPINGLHMLGLSVSGGGSGGGTATLMGYVDNFSTALITCTDSSSLATGHPGLLTHSPSSSAYNAAMYWTDTLQTPPANLYITNQQSLPGATQYQSYSQTMSAANGTPPYTWSIVSSSSYATLPEGMTIGASTGTISSSSVGGQGMYTFEIQVQDSASNTATQTFTIDVTADNTNGGCSFPSDSIFYQPTTGLPVDTSPAAAIPSAYQGSGITSFFGDGYNNFPNGIPWIRVPYNQPTVTITYTQYGSTSDPGPFPIPSNAPVEGTANSTGDRHVVVVQTAGGGNSCQLYELYTASQNADGSWNAAAGAHWNMGSDALRSTNLSATTAAGLPIFPILVNYDETMSANGIQHVMYFVINQCLAYFVWPARDAAWGTGSCGNSSGTITALSQISQSSPPTSCTWGAPFGEMYRLKASVNVASICPLSTNPQSYAILTAMQKYGIIIGDNGGTGLCGTPDARWNNNDLSCLQKVTLSNFEPVNVSSLQMNPDSGQTSLPSIPPPTGLRIQN